MSKVQEIERAIEELSEEEVAEIHAWLWDHDIRRKATTGAFDAVAEDALQEHRAGKSRNL